MRTYSTVSRHHPLVHKQRTKCDDLSSGFPRIWLRISAQDDKLCGSRVKTNCLFLSISLMAVTAVWADDFETPGERRSLDLQLLPFEQIAPIPGWHDLPTPRATLTTSRAGESHELAAMRMERKLDAIRIPEIIFEQTTLRDAICWLRGAIRQNDPDGWGSTRGIPVLFQLTKEDVAFSSPVTLRLTNPTVREILAHLATRVEFRTAICPHGILIAVNR